MQEYWHPNELHHLKKKKLPTSSGMEYKCFEWCNKLTLCMKALQENKNSVQARLINRLKPCKIKNYKIGPLMDR